MSIKYDKDYYKSWQDKYFKNSMKTLAQLRKFKGYYKRWFYIMRESSSNRFKNEIYQIIIDKFSEDLLKHKNNQKISTLAKWLPRENSSIDKELNFVDNITKRMFPTLPKNQAKQLYRKNIVILSNKLGVLESLMSQKRLSEINFKKIPDIAFKRNANNFIKYPELMNKFIEEYMSRLDRKNAEHFIEELINYSQRTPFERGLIKNAFNLKKNRFFSKHNSSGYLPKECVPVLDTSNRNLKSDRFKKQLLSSLYFASETNKIIINSDTELKCLEFDWKVDFDRRIQEVYKYLDESHTIDTSFILEQMNHKNRLVIFYDKNIDIKVTNKNLDRKVFILGKPRRTITKKTNNFIILSIVLLLAILFYCRYI